MSWIDRLKELAYTPPNSDRLILTYEEIETSFDKKATAFEFIDVSSTYIQQLGNTSKRIPLRLFFWGSDYDLEVFKFEESLKLKGVGKLEHPFYGIINVVPFGTIARRDDLKTQANQAILDVTFWETVDLTFPVSSTDPKTSIINSVNEYNTEVSNEFNDAISIGNAVEEQSFQKTYLNLLDSTKSGLDSIAETQEDIEKQFNAVDRSINTGIDVLVGDPLTLAFQTTIMIQAPARAISSISDRLNAYGNLSKKVINNLGIVSQGNDSVNSNKYHNNDLYASTYVSGSILSVVNNTFETKPDALSAADAIINQFTDVTNWRDDNYESLGEIDTGDAYQKLQEAVAITVGFLVEISFDLKQERSIKLDRNRSIIDLTAELYGTVDDKLDFFINSNNLTGDEIKEVPRGRTIVYYV